MQYIYGDIWKLYFFLNNLGNERGEREDKGREKKDLIQNLTSRDCHHHQKLIRSRRELGETSFTFIT